MANRQVTTSIGAVGGGIRAVIKAARTALPSHALKGIPIRCFVTAVSQAEVAYARDDLWTIFHRVGAAPLSDRHHDPDCDVADSAVSTWLSRLIAHDSDRHGPSARWHRWGREERTCRLRRRRYLLSGLLRVAARYSAARTAYEGGFR